MTDKKSSPDTDDRLWNLIQDTARESNLYVTKAIEVYLDDMKKSPVATRQLETILTGQEGPVVKKKNK